MLSKIKILALIGFCATTSACVDPPPPVTADPALLEQVYVESVPLLFVRRLSRQCPTIDFKPLEYYTAEKAIAQRLRDAGVPQKSAGRLIGESYKKRFQDDFLRFVDRYDIVIADPDSWCAAGNRMIDRNDQYGFYLQRV